MNDLIIIEGIEFYAHHGVTDEEQFIGHRYFVDATLEVDLHRAGETDSVEDTVSYSSVSRLIAKVGTSERYRLLEKLATVMVQALFNEFPAIQSVTLKVGKRLPPAKLVVKNAAIQMTRRRAE